MTKIENQDMRKHLKGLLLTTAISTSMIMPAMAHAQDDADAVEEIVVTGIRGSMISSIAAKRDAKSVMDVINAEDIGKFPDTNLAESLQRISGVQIARDGSEGTAISIRGMDPDFTRVTINGQAGAPADSRGGFNFSLFGSEMAASIEVIKSVTAGHEEGGMGGTVNIKTRRALDFKDMKLAASARMSYEDFSEKTDPYVTFLAANQFADGKFGVLLSGKYSKRRYRQDYMEIRGWHLLDLDGDGEDTDMAMGRTRNLSRFRDAEQYDVNASFQFRPTDALELYADLTYANKAHDQQDNQLEYDFSDAAGRESNFESYTLSDNGDGFNTVDSATFKASKKKGDLAIRDQATHESRESLTAVAGGKWSNDVWDIQGAISYAKGLTRTAQESTQIKLDDGKHGLSLGYNINPEFESNIGAPVPMSLFVYDGDGAALDVSDPNFWSARVLDGEENCGDSGSKYVRCTFAGAGGRWIDVENLSANLDFDREIEVGDINAIEFGVRFRERTRDASKASNKNPEGFEGLAPDILDNGAVFGAGFGSEAPFADFAGVTLPAYFDGQVLRDQIHAAGGVDRVSEFQPGEFLYSAEKTFAAYAMANLEGELGTLPYRGNIGLRAVKTDNTSQGLAFDEENDQGLEETYTLIEDGGSYWDILPSANLVLMPKDNLLLRFAVSSVMTRPRIQDVTSFFTYKIEDDVNGDEFLDLEDSISVKMGNAELEPFRAWQYDAAIEYYTESGGLFNLGLFYKDVTSFITDGGVDMCSDPTGGTLPGGAPGFVGDTCYFGGSADNGAINFVQKVNGEGATIKGFEIGVQQAFNDILPSPFDGFGVQANYTYVDSSSPLVDNITGVDLPLEGVSKDSYNLVLFYEKYKFSGRVAYNYRSEYLVTAFDDLSDSSRMRSARGQLDASVSYDINEQFSVFANAINLTNEDTMDYVSHESRLRRWTKNGRRFYLGLRFKY